MPLKISQNQFVQYRMAKLLASDGEEILELSNLSEDEVKEIERNYEKLRWRYRHLFY